MRRVEDLAALEARVARCRRCPRLVAHRERVARVKVARFREWTYWGRAVPGFGDPRARVLVVGLAPAAHGANRTGRMFTGDESGNWLFAALHRTGFANQAAATSPGDGLRLRGVYVSAVARCAPPANKPTLAEIATCRPYLLRELDLFTELRAVVVLGRIAHQGLLAALRARGDRLPTPQPLFGHGAIHRLPGGLYLVCSYHPSQQNTFTKRLTRPMLERVFRDARRVARLPARAEGTSTRGRASVRRPDRLRQR